ncbi:MAG: flagellar biosynthesis protein FlhB [Oscillospiraceae bacterium]|jgi:flagellar biosynthetic protein FlhB|nr:flagellar biosynthesis protein FlhB [Oscillospiraceae bacterium]
MPQQNKTEKATPRRRQEQRKEGRTAQSQDLTLVLSLFGVFCTIKLFMPYATVFIKDYYVYVMENLSSLVKDGLVGQRPFLIKTVSCFFLSAFPIILVAGLCGVLFTGLQTGFLVSKKAMAFKFSHFNPVNGFKNMFSGRAFVKLASASLKTVVVGWVLYLGYRKSAESFACLIDVDLGCGILFIVKELSRIVFNLFLALLGIAAFDYFYNWWSFEKSIKMTKQEVKEEYKQLEGDPQIKGFIRRRQRQLARSRMMQMVPKADVVIRNPTHFAVALKYEQEKDFAPKVIAKGADNVALKIIEIAKESDVPIIEDKSLARTLYKSVKLGKMIPSETFKAVAEVLVWVYRMKKKNLEMEELV